MKKVLSLFFVIIIMVLLCAEVFALDVYGLDTSKIEATLLKKLEESKMDELIPVVIWFTDIDHSEVESKALSLASEIEKPAFEKTILSNTSVNLFSSEACSFYATSEKNRIKEMRRMHAEVYQRENRRMQQKIISAFSKKQVAMSASFVSSYTPCITMELTKFQIYYIATMNEIDFIYYDWSSELKGEDLMDVASEVTGANYLERVKGLTGVGLKIGMIESGLPRINSTCYNVSNIHLDDQSSYFTDHASLVSSIMVGQLEGIAPDAELYCTTTTTLRGAWRGGIEWLVSCGVNIINISNSLVNDVSSYNECSRWIDHIAIQHDVHVVVAAGNVGYGKLASPGWGNNVICVGATDDKGTVDLSDDVLDGRSCYVSTEYKPDLCAPGVGITAHIVNEENSVVYYTDSGTSFAAPQVAAGLALLCQQNSSLLRRQDMAKSLLMAGTRKFETVSASGSGNHIAMTTGYGSGSMDLKNSSYINVGGRCRGTSMSAGDRIYTFDFTVSSNDDFIRVAVSWLRNTRFDNEMDHVWQYPNEVSLSNLKLTVTAPNGTQWVSSNARGSVQIVAFSPQQVGTYTITIERTSGVGDKIYFGFAWY